MSEQVTFYPTYGYRHDNGWRIPMRVWVHEERGLIKHVGRLIQHATEQLVDVEVAEKAIARLASMDQLASQQRQRFRSRIAPFVMDSESRETVIFQFDKDSDQEKFRVRNEAGEFADTDLSGRVEGFLDLSEMKAKTLQKTQGTQPGWLTYHVVSQGHSGAGRIKLIDPQGFSVISDIDDTVKITGIPEGKAVVLRRTFFEEFSASPGMAQMYQQLGPEVSFHYVSGGPWQMYGALVDFLFSPQVGFPPGSFHMKDVRTHPLDPNSWEDLWKLVASGPQGATFEGKIQQISEIMGRFPEKKFILIGDSGEKDPEVYHTIREQFPTRVQEIRIREVSSSAGERLKEMKIIDAETGHLRVS